MIFLGGSSCLLDPVEAPPTTSDAEEAVDTTASTTSTAPRSPTTQTTTGTSPPETTVTTATTTQTTTGAAFPTEVVQDYLKNLLAHEVGFSRLVDQISAISNDWDNRSETEVTYSETEEDLEAAVENLQTAQADFDLVQPPPTGRYPEKHLTVASAVGQIAVTAAEMLEGLRSTDAGEQRHAAQAGMVAAFGVFTQGIAEIIAEYIGDDEIASLIVSRDLTVTAPAAPVTTTTTTRAPATTTTSQATTTTTTSQATTTTTEAPATTKPSG